MLCTCDPTSEKVDTGSSVQSAQLAKDLERPCLEKKIDKDSERHPVLISTVHAHSPHSMTYTKTQHKKPCSIHTQVKERERKRDRIKMSHFDSLFLLILLLKVLDKKNKKTKVRPYAVWNGF